MTTSFKTTFHGLQRSEALEARIRQKVEWLQQNRGPITSCHVIVEQPHVHGNKGGLFEIRIHIEVPGAHIDVTREPAKSHAHEDAYVALRDAFDRARRKLEERERRRREVRVR